MREVEGNSATNLVKMCKTFRSDISAQYVGFLVSYIYKRNNIQV